MLVFFGDVFTNVAISNASLITHVLKDTGTNFLMHSFPLSSGAFELCWTLDLPKFQIVYDKKIHLETLFFLYFLCDIFMSLWRL